MLKNDGKTLQYTYIHDNTKLVSLGIKNIFHYT